MSLRRRLLVGLIGVAAVLIVTNLVLSNTIQSFLLDRVDRQLVDVVTRPVFRGDPGPGFGFPSNDERTLSEYFIAVGDPNQSTLNQLSSALADEDDSPPRLARTQVLSHLTDHSVAPEPFTAPATNGRGSWRLVAVQDPRQFTVVVGVSLADVDQTIDRLRLVQVLGTMSVLAALGLVSWWMLRLGVHPIENMARTADLIAAGDLSPRVDHPGERTEAGRLGVALNAMLARIEDAFRAREASEARVRRFAADASHELRTPLTSIQGYAELWRAGGLRGESDLTEAMRRMEQEARRMGALVEDLLLLARLDQHRPLERSMLRLDTLVADAVSDARVVSPTRPIELTSSPVSVYGDEMRLRQVAANLLSNASTHTPADTPVRVSVGVVDGRARLRVADEGPGLAPEVAAKVFERFYRADPARTRSGGGTGLGLSIVAAIAEAHEGRATVISEVGRGSVFEVELPLPVPDAVEAPETSEGPPTEEAVTTEEPDVAATPQPAHRWFSG